MYLSAILQMGQFTYSTVFLYLPTKGLHQAMLLVLCPITEMETQFQVLYYDRLVNPVVKGTSFYRVCIHLQDKQLCQKKKFLLFYFIANWAHP